MLAIAAAVVFGIYLLLDLLDVKQTDLYNFPTFAALGFLAGRPGLETARLLTDYVNWETRPVLRRRGQLLLRRMHAYLD